MRLTRTVGLLLPVVLLAGCGAGNDDASPADRTMRAYFDGVATRTVESLGEAVDAADPGSPAAAYATYLRASAQAWADSGHPVRRSRQSADQKAAGFTFCDDSGSGKVCFDYADITRADGKVSDFTINDKPISDRLAVGDTGPVRFDGLDASASFVAAIEPTEGAELLVAVRITSGTRLALDAFDASYRSPGGTETASTDLLGPGTLDAGSSATYVFAFAEAKVGGTVTLSVSGGSVALVVGPSLGR